MRLGEVRLGGGHTSIVIGITELFRKYIYGNNIVKHFWEQYRNMVFGNNIVIREREEPHIFKHII